MGIALTSLTKFKQNFSWVSEKWITLELFLVKVKLRRKRKLDNLRF